MHAADAALVPSTVDVMAMAITNQLLITLLLRSSSDNPSSHFVCIDLSA
jgi:hypothetical protein